METTKKKIIVPREIREPTEEERKQAFKRYKEIMQRSKRDRFFTDSLKKRNT